MFLKTALLAFVLPFAIAAVLVLITRRRRWGFVLGVGAGYVVGHLASGWPGFPPLDVNDRIPWLVLIAVLLGSVESIVARIAAVRWVDRLLLAALTYVAILGPLLGDLTSRSEGRVWLSVAAAFVVLSWVSLELLGTRTGGGSAFLVPLGIAVAGAGAVLLATGSAVLGLAGLSLAVAMGAAWLASLRAESSAGSLGVIPVAATAITALVLTGYVYSSLPTACAVLLAIAPVAAWVSRIGPLRKLAAWKQALISAVVVLVPVGVALWLALAQAEPTGYE